MVIVCDCGTTNTKLYGVERAVCVSENYIRAGIKDIAINGGTRTLKQQIKEGIEQLCREMGIGMDQIERVIAYGMITSEIGFINLPHSTVPAGLTELRNTVMTVFDPDLIGGHIPVTYIRGVQNRMDMDTDLSNALQAYDFMRGEETQAMGVLAMGLAKAPCSIIVLSSHSKLISINSRNQIAGSFTTMSGQYYQVIKENTTIGKSLVSDGKEALWEPDSIIRYAQDCVHRCGFTRSTMIPRFMDTVGGFHAKDRDLFMQAIIVCEDMKVFDLAQENGMATQGDCIVIGQKERCELFAKVTHNKLGEDIKIRIVDSPEQIRDIGIAGAIAICGCQT